MATQPLSNRTCSVSPPFATMIGAGLAAVAATAVALLFLSRGHALFSVPVASCGGVAGFSLAVFAVASVMACLRRKQHQTYDKTPSPSAPPNTDPGNSGLGQMGASPHSMTNSPIPPSHPPQGASPGAVTTTSLSSASPPLRPTPRLSASTPGLGVEGSLGQRPPPSEGNVPLTSTPLSASAGGAFRPPGQRIGSPGLSPSIPIPISPAEAPRSLDGAESPSNLSLTASSTGFFETPPETRIPSRADGDATPTPGEGVEHSEETTRVPSATSFLSMTGDTSSDEIPLLNGSMVGIPAPVRGQAHHASTALPDGQKGNGLPADSALPALEIPLPQAPLLPHPLTLVNDSTAGIPAPAREQGHSASTAVPDGQNGNGLPADSSPPALEIPPPQTSLLPPPLTLVNDSTAGIPAPAREQTRHDSTASLDGENGKGLPENALPSASAAASLGREEDVQVDDFEEDEEDDGFHPVDEGDESPGQLVPHQPQYTQVPTNPGSLPPAQLEILIGDIVASESTIPSRTEALISQLLAVFMDLASEHGKKYHLAPIDQSYRESVITFLAPFLTTMLTPSLLIWSAFVDSKEPIQELIEHALDKAIKKLRLNATITAVISSISTVNLHLESHYDQIESSLPGGWRNIAQRTVNLANRTANAAQRSLLEASISRALPKINDSWGGEKLSSDNLTKITPFVTSFFVQYRTINSPLMALFQKHLNACRTAFAPLHDQGLELGTFATRTLTTASQHIQNLAAEIRSSSR